MVKGYKTGWKNSLHTVWNIILNLQGYVELYLSVASLYRNIYGLSPFTKLIMDYLSLLN